HGKPIIFAVNHQNAFLDALVITCSSKILPYYLARAEVFTNSFGAKLLSFIRIMPIYRFRDGLANVKKNDAIIEVCQDILSRKETLVMFPEGNHAEEWTLRLLQRGLSRIAFKTESLAKFSLDVQIVPVGIQYEGPKSFRSRLLVQFGKPISMKSYEEAYKENERESLDLLKSDIYKAMKPLVLHIPEKKYEEIEPVFLKKRIYKKDLVEQLKCDQELVDSLIKEQEIKQESDPKEKFIGSLLFSLPVWLINVIPYKITNWFIDKFIKDKVFVSSIKFASGITLVPIYYLLISCTVFCFTGNYWIAFLTLISLPIISILGFDGIKKLQGK
ncbi:MAG: 1-acyl-sn-glycerol-3-phosphate acyltransferase, partial [Flavobacteriaceae bacterium]|nr:1-acyl-sn-glycerol-3-phosphate acyltransferase [Flavobacteriaceae bacterium]